MLFPGNELFRGIAAPIGDVAVRAIGMQIGPGPCLQGRALIVRIRQARQAVHQTRQDGL